MNGQMLGLGAIVILTTGLGLSAAADPAADADAKDLARFDGTWELTSSTTDGKVADLANRKRVVLVFDGGRMAAIGDAPTGFGTIKVDASKGPTHLDCTYGDSPAKTATSRCISKFDGDILTICCGGIDPMTRRGKPRPEQFAAREGMGTTLLVYRRAKSDIRLRDLHFPAYLNVPPAH